MLTFISLNGVAYSQSTIELANATLPAHPATPAGSPTPFTTINFLSPFASPPNVFALTPEFGAGADDDPCT